MGVCRHQSFQPWTATLLSALTCSCRQLFTTMVFKCVPNVSLKPCSPMAASNHAGVNVLVLRPNHRMLPHSIQGACFRSACEAHLAAMWLSIRQPGGSGAARLPLEVGLVAQRVVGAL